MDTERPMGPPQPFHTDRSQAETRNRFSYHPPSCPLQVDLHRAVGDLFLNAALELDKLLPYGREKAQAMSSLADARMQANAAVAIGLNPIPADASCSGTGSSRPPT